MNLQAVKDAFQTLKVPLQGICIVVLCCAAFIVWLGLLAVLTKAIMG